VATALQEKYEFVLEENELPFSISENFPEEASPEK